MMRKKSKESKLGYTEKLTQETLRKLLIEKAGFLIYPERLGQLEEYLSTINENYFNGAIQDCALDIIKEINNGNLDKAKRMLGENDFYPPIIEFIWKFGKTGPEFLMSNYKDSQVCQRMLGILANSDRYGYDQITAENHQFAEAEQRRQGTTI